MPVDVNEYFTADDPNFAERLNNPNILTDIFTIKPRITLPGAFKTGEYPETENKTKAVFSIVQVINNTCTNTGDGFTATANNQEFTLRVYPNFSGFKWWNSITWNGTGTITCLMKDSETGTTLISSILSGTSLNSYNIEHKSVDIIFTLQNGARATNITFEYLNQPKLSESEWSIPKNNITGLNSVLDTKADKTSVDAIFDIMYPVGIILEFDRDTNPNEISGWKGTWAQIKDKFTLAAGDIYTVGQTGGSASQQLSEAEMPQHKHDVATNGGGATTSSTNGNHRHTITNSGDAASWEAGSDKTEWISGTGSTRYTDYDGNHAHSNPAHNHNISEANKGSNQAHNNMPPYIVVSKWVRTA
jgi:microcystin-dependent protein